MAVARLGSWLRSTERSMLGADADPLLIGLNEIGLTAVEPELGTGCQMELDGDAW
jgi:hypothetical protein